jgi:flavorubredoxin
MSIPTLPSSPHEIAPDTWVVPTFAAEPGGAFLAVHSLVIRGEEPALVDTGAVVVAETWLEDAFSLVEPSDVRWIFLSHDDDDHVGNLAAVLDACPQATVIANFSIASRLSGRMDVDLTRYRFLDAGQSLTIGDRTITAVRPPVFDAPGSRGFHDSATNVLWAADAFGSLLPGAVFEADDVPDDLYEASFATLNSWNTPWLEWVDVDRFTTHVQRCMELPVDVVASAHGPVLRGERIADAFRRTLALAAQPAVPWPGQDVLELLVAAATSGTAAAA